ncbi:MAG: TonB family protein [Flavobacteriaceae bacterium]
MNLFKSAWVDTVFEGRNQEYGAYTLRKENGKVTLLALLIGAVMFSFAVSFPVISRMLAKDEVVEEKSVEDTKIIMAEILTPPPPEEVIEQPKVIKQTKTIQEVVKHTPPVIVEQETVEQEVTSVDDLKDKIAGSIDIEASPDGEVVIDNSHAEVTVDAEIIDENHIYMAVEVAPSYPGGIDEFRKFVARNYNLSPDRDIKGNVIVQFVVEKDGSLTDIEVVRDLGYGAGAEAVRVLKRAKKWNPGVQNGRNVRVKYTLPIQINIKGN